VTRVIRGAPSRADQGVVHHPLEAHDVPPSHHYRPRHRSRPCRRRREAHSAATGPSVNELDGQNAFAEVIVTATPSLSAQLVDWSTADGTAKDGSDYGGQASGLVVFAPLQTSRSIFIPIEGDTLHEGDETFDVNFSGSTLTSAATQTVTIVDNDAAPSAAIGDATVHEAEGTASFPVTLSAVSGLPATIDWSTADDSARAGGDYTAAHGQLTFAPGETTKTVSVAIVNDAVHEADERFAVGLSSPIGATLADASALGTILDDDPVPAAPPARLAPQDTQSRSDGHVGPGVANAYLSRLAYAGLTKGGRVRLKAWCANRPGCSGVVRLRANGRTVGSAVYVLRSGAQRVITVKLSSGARKTLTRRHRLTVVARTGGGPVKGFTVKR